MGPRVAFLLLGFLFTAFAPTVARADVCTVNTRGTLQCNGRKTADALPASRSNKFQSYTCADTAFDIIGDLHDDPDDIFKFVCPRAGRVTFRLDSKTTFLGSSCDLDLFVLGTCSAGNCVRGDDDTADPTDVYYDCAGTETVWVVIEGYGVGNSHIGCTAVALPPTFQGSYDIWPICREECADGEDDDFDGTTDLADADCCDIDGDGALDKNRAICLALGGNDCNDGNSAIRPNAAEVTADGVDQNCDGKDQCFVDADNDTFGSALTMTSPNMSCIAAGRANNSLDCKDTGANAANIKPGAAEIAADGVDQDCDGVDSCFVDADGDGYGVSTIRDGADLICAGEPGLSATNNDCLDVGANAATTSPGAPEVCNTRDDDCDGQVDDNDPNRTGGTTWYRDLDGDGYGGSVSTTVSCTIPAGHYGTAADCLDSGSGSAAINPGATEVPGDGVDQDCNSRDTCYVDADRDGFGSAATQVGPDLTCTGETALSANRDDCLDSGANAAATNPNASEVCNTRDDDCDTLIDDNDPSRSGGTVWYRDADGDGYAGSATTITSCSAPAGYFASATDCVDTGSGASSINPGATEVPGDGADQDCNNRDTCYVDADRDGYGSTATQVGPDLTCAGEVGLSANSDDCRDSGVNASTTNPGAPEVCNTRDDDCDNLVDDNDPSRTGGSVWYRDVDGDGYAGTGTTVTSCTPPAGYYATAPDCVDTGSGASAINPGATEVVGDGVDQDCNSRDTCYVDADRDGFGSSNTQVGPDLSCTGEVGLSANDEDCRDSGSNAASTYPGAPETCNNRDDDCDTLIDDADPDRTGGTTWYFDADGDGYGGPETTVSRCVAPLAHYASPSDCRDVGPNAASFYPGASDTPGDGLDQDCNNRDTCFVDVDRDGFGSTSAQVGPDLTCDGEAGLSASDEDCLDSGANAASTFPGAPETCNGRDDDCDGLADDADPDRVGGATWYRDVDGDGFAGTAVTSTSCQPAAGYYAAATDCRDQGAGAASVYPGAPEVPVDGLDQDCNGGDLCYVDADRDGFGSTSTAAGPDLTCVGEVGLSGNDRDCVDVGANARATFPGASEICNGRDDDCDALVDDADPGRVGGALFYRDVDGDGFAGSATTTNSCTVPAGYFPSALDCRDLGPGAAAVYPGAPEIPVDGEDQDCDGVDLCFVDDDRDGFGSSSTAAGSDLNCAGEVGLAPNDDDCVDVGANASTTFPGAPETCNNRDDDCDGLIDDADPGRVGGAVWFADADGDGFAGTDVTTNSCRLPAGYFETPLDCVDSGPGASAFYPGAPETAGDGIDQDCDGTDHCWRDRDGDGHGAGTPLAGDDLVCGNLAGESPDDDDCDDTAASVGPGAPEVCNGIDDDCDLLVDDEDDDRVGGAAVWYYDADGDGFAGQATTAQSCSPPPGYFASPTDCLDVGPLAATTWPGAPEIAADGLDQDCDGNDHCWRDQDGDGFGGLVAQAGDDLDCGNAPGESARADDCVDAGPGAAAIYPTAAEVCDSFDNDCDSLIDDADDSRSGGSVWYRDLDGDGFAGSASVSAACTQPGGHFAVATDCRDSGEGAASVFPGAPEVVADGRDQDCDGLDDCWIDVDQDGFGGASSAPGDDILCGNAIGEATRTGDCLDVGDFAEGTNPEALELCNGRDDDCDGLVDDRDDVSLPTRWYLDGDGDGYYGLTTWVEVCTAPPGYGPGGSDCDDTLASVSPSAAEVCNGRDDDCDFLVDGADEVDVPLAAFVDADSDGHGDPARATVVFGCSPPAGYAALGDDCDDSTEAVAPGVPEIPYDRIDQDCVGGDLVDLDGDGFAGGLFGADCVDVAADIHPAAEEYPDGVDEDCDGDVDNGTIWWDDDGDGVADAGGDCDDTTVFRGLTGREVCDGFDDDCDGTIDEDTPCFDDDRDGWTEDEGDCNDGDRTVHPAAIDAAAAGVDSNCDGALVRGDVDGDGYSEAGGDCDDDQAVIRPGAVERADGVDDDCDGFIDEGTSQYDDDFDGSTEDAGDCDDGDPDVGPGVLELLGNWRDDDCDGLIDEGGAMADDDGDGFTEDSGDCDDDNDRIYPYGREIDNGLDDNCDGVVDETWDDADADGWSIPEGDCDDADGWANPEADEICDGVDNNCDGRADEVCVELPDFVPDGEVKDETGCGCAHGPSPGLGWLALALAFARRRR